MLVHHVTIDITEIFKLKDLPDPDGPLSESVNPCSITSVNREVLEEIRKTKLNPKKHGHCIK